MPLDLLVSEGRVNRGMTSVLDTAKSLSLWNIHIIKFKVRYVGPEAKIVVKDKFLGEIEVRRRIGNDKDIISKDSFEISGKGSVN